MKSPRRQYSRRQFSPYQFGHIIRSGFVIRPDLLQLLLTITVILSTIILSTIFALIHVINHTANPHVQRAAKLSNISALQILISFPQSVTLKQSYVIKVSLVPKVKKGFVSGITVETVTTLASNPTPIGTPGQTLQNSFGPGYEPFASAILYAGTFTVQPSELQERSLQQENVEWDWNITPQEAGRQVISIQIEIDLHPTKMVGNTVPASYVIGTPQLGVQVDTPFDWGPIISTAEVVVGGILLAFFTWIGAQIWKWVVEQKKRKQTKSIRKKPTLVTKKKP